MSLDGRVGYVRRIIQAVFGGSCEGDREGAGTGKHEVRMMGRIYPCKARRG